MKKYLALGLLLSLSSMLFNSVKAIETPFTLFQTGLEASSKTNSDMKLALAAMYDLLPADTPAHIALKNKLGAVYQAKFGQYPDAIDLSNFMPRFATLIREHGSQLKAYSDAAMQAANRLRTTQAQLSQEQAGRNVAEKALSAFLAKFADYGSSLNHLIETLRTAQNEQVLFAHDLDNPIFARTLAQLRNAWNSYQNHVQDLENEPGLGHIDLANLRSGALKTIVDSVLSTHTAAIRS